MSTEAPPPAASQRPRPLLLFMLGAVVIAAFVYWQWPAASPQPSPSNQASARPGPGQAPRVAAAQQSALDVHLDALKQPAPEPSDAERNPFRFQPKAPPPPPSAAVTPPPVAVAPPIAPPVATGPPPPPPIPLKFIGRLEAAGPGKVAIFSDGKGMPVYGHEGEIVLGQYRVVRIGVESVVMEYADGRGRTTIPLTGQ